MTDSRGRVAPEVMRFVVTALPRLRVMAARSARLLGMPLPGQEGPQAAPGVGSLPDEVPPGVEPRRSHSAASGAAPAARYAPARDGVAWLQNEVRTRAEGAARRMLPQLSATGVPVGGPAARTPWEVAPGTHTGLGDLPTVTVSGTHTGPGGLPAGTAPVLPIGPGGPATVMAPGRHTGPGSLPQVVAPSTHAGLGGLPTVVAPGTHAGPGGLTTGMAPGTHAGPGDLPAQMASGRPTVSNQLGWSAPPRATVGSLQAAQPGRVGSTTEASLRAQLARIIRDDALRHGIDLDKEW